MIHHISRIPLDWKKPVTLFFFGDLQLGTDGFSKEAWQEFKEEFIGTPNSYALGLGDYSDWLRPSMRGRLMGPMAHDDSARRQLDAMYRKSQDKMLDELEFLKGKLIGLHTGHHEHDFSDGTNGTQRLCSALKAPYLSWMASTRFCFYSKYNKRFGLIFTVISMHGTGAARYATTDSRWLEVNIVPAFEANLYVKGHGCKSVAWIPFERQNVRRVGIAGLDKTLIRCLNVGGFSQGYTDGWRSSYVEKAGLTPQPIGWAIARFRLTRKDKNKPTGRSGHGYLSVEHLTKHPRNL